MQKRMYDIGWSGGREVRKTRSQRVCKKFEGGLEVAKRHLAKYPLSGSSWRVDHLAVRRLESEKHRNWRIPVEGYRDHVTGVLGRWSACGWSVVQLDHDGEMGPTHGMYVTLDAYLEVQRTIKTAEMRAFS